MTLLTESLRPHSLKEVIGQDHVVSKLTEYVQNYHAGKPDMPHLLFSGGPGTGKTSCAFALCQDLFGSDWKSYVLSLNASDENGIDVMREKVKAFARTTTLGANFSIVVLDECDQITPQAQGALRRIMEDYSGHCRFILSCNYRNKIIEPIQDRCATFRFATLTPEQIRSVIVKLAPERADEISKRSRGSLRRALTMLSEGPSYVAPEEKVREVIGLCLGDKVREAEEATLRLLRGGVEAGELFEAFFDVIDGSPLQDKAKNRILSLLGEAEYRCATGSQTELQFRCFLRTLWLQKVGG